MTLTKPVPEQLLKAVPKSSSAFLQFQVTDETETDIIKANINTATMALTNKADGSTINNHTATDIMSDISTGGFCSRHLTASDNIIVSSDDDIEEEAHVATILINATSGLNTIDLRWVYYITVLNPQ